MEIVATASGYLEGGYALIEVWDTPLERLRELQEQSIRLTLQMEREHWVHIYALFHPE